MIGTYDINDFHEERDVTSNQKALDFARREISKWASTIPHHTFTNLGGIVEITLLRETPYYQLDLVTQYLEREVGDGSRPYKGERIPERTIRWPNEVRIWEYDIEFPEGFTKKQETKTIPESKHVEPCSVCNGSKTEVCGSCSGQRETICERCNGDGKRSCNSCNGKGDRQCTDCWGKGHYSSGGRCRTCNGTGYNKCKNCHAKGFLRCEACLGRGLVTCSECLGRGSVTCSGCGGTGAILAYLTLQSRYSYTAVSSLTSMQGQPIEFSDEAWMRKTQHGRAVMAITTNHIDHGDSELKEALSKVLNRKVETAGRELLYRSSSVASANKKNIVSYLLVNKFRVLEVSYRLDGGDYVLYLLGDKHIDSGLTVFSESSPISDLAKELIESSKALKDNRDLSGALDLVEKSIPMFHSDSERQAAVKLFKKVRFMIGLQYTAGGIIGLLLVSVVALLISSVPSTSPMNKIGESLFSRIGLVPIAIGLFLGISSASLLNRVRRIKFKRGFGRIIFGITVAGLIYIMSVGSCFAITTVSKQSGPVLSEKLVKQKGK